MHTHIKLSFLIVLLLLSSTLTAQTAKSYFTAGVVKLSGKNYEDAIRNFNKAIKMDKTYADAYFNRAIAYSQIGKDKRAIKDYSNLIKINSEMETAFINRGLLFQEKGDLELAITDFCSAIKLNPDNGFTALHRARAYRATGRLLQAEEDYLFVLQRLPNLQVVHSDLIDFYSAQNKYSQCIPHYDYLIGLHPNKGEYFEGRAKAYEETEKPIKACEDYKKAIELGITIHEETVTKVCGK